MKRLLETAAYRDWMSALRDRKAVFRVSARVNRLMSGNAGDSRPVGEGVIEMRIHYGPGYRVYYKVRGNEIVILLAGGTKKTQSEDIELAKRLAADY